MITIDIPREWLLTSNQRLHWAHKARLTRLIRLRSQLFATAQTLAAAKDQYPLVRARLTAEVQWPDGRRRDVHNLMPTVKAVIDGCVDAGILLDDDDAHLIGPDLRVSEQRCAKGLACTLTLIFEEV